MSDVEEAAAPEVAKPSPAKEGAKRPRGRPPGPPKPPKEKKPRGRPQGSGTGPRPKPNHEPYNKLVERALDDIYAKGGVSKRAIVTHIIAHEPECQDKKVVQKRVKTVLKKLVATGILVAPKAAVGKFRRIDDTPGRGRKKGTTVKKSDGVRVALKKKSPKKVAKPKKVKPSPKKGSPKKGSTKSASATPGKRGRPKKNADAKPAKTAAAKTKTPGKRGRPKKQ